MRYESPSEVIAAAKKALEEIESLTCQKDINKTIKEHKEKNSNSTQSTYGLHR